MIKLTATENKVIKPGFYHAVLDQMEERDGTYVGKTGETENGTYINWKFAICTEGFEGTTVYASSSTNFGPQSKARKWSSVILGRQIQTGEVVTEDMLVGRECTLALEVENDKQGNQRNKVVTIMPAQSGPGSAEVQAPQALVESAETAGLLREFMLARKVLAWKEEAFTLWVEREANTSQPFDKLPLDIQRTVMVKLRDIVEHADQYDENGDLKF